MCHHTMNMMVDPNYLNSDLIINLFTVTSWSTWQAWSGCSTSCGGGIQTRNRTCGKPNIPNVIPNCYGDNVLYRNCSTWKCPGKLKVRFPKLVYQKKMTTPSSQAL